MISGKTTAMALTTFGMAVVITNSLRSVEWLHPVHINTIGFMCVGVGGARQLRLRDKHPTSRFPW